MPQYLEDATNDAKHMALALLDEIVKSLLRTGDALASEEYADYDGGITYMRERVLDLSYTEAEAEALLAELHQYEETDTSLWKGEKPVVAIAIRVNYAYGNAVTAFFTQIISTINDAGTMMNAVAEIDSIDVYLDGLLDTLAEGEDPVEVRARVLERREVAVGALTEAVKAIIDAF